jgi:NTP pyrophosphatase (non-canonical NTP hydrolase)
MEKNERLALYDAAIAKWGVGAQKYMAYEEIGELLTALARDDRGRVTTEELLTELADVTIMCEQMAYILGFEEYEKEKDRKLIRLRDDKLKL